MSGTRTLAVGPSRFSLRPAGRSFLLRQVREAVSCREVNADRNITRVSCRFPLHVIQIRRPRPAAALAQERPTPMLNGHQAWLDGLVAAASE